MFGLVLCPAKVKLVKNIYKEKGNCCLLRSLYASDGTQLDPTPDRLKKKGFYLGQNLTREQKPIWPTIIQGAQGTQDSLGH
jgi:hypothetical protein